MRVDKITKGVRLIPNVHYIVIGYQVPVSSCTLRITGSLKLEILIEFKAQLKFRYQVRPLWFISVIATTVGLLDIHM